MKKFRILFVCLVLFFSGFVFSGCTSGQVSLFLTAYPSKIAYELNETVKFDGLKVESLNTDGTTTRQEIKKDNIESVDTSTAGEKIVKVTKGDISTTFSIYVANVVVDNKQDLKSAIVSSKDGDIIYIKKGEYKPDDNQDESLYNILIDKKLTLVGDGNNNTIIHGNFLVGATEVEQGYLPQENFEDVKFINLGFKLNSTVQNRYNIFEGAYGNYDVFGAIKTYNSKKIYVANCSFDGYSYGINSDNITGLTVKNCTFRNIKINAIRINNDIKNSCIDKCSFMDIGSNSLVMENSTQGNVSALYLAFASEENKGVIVSNNIFVRIALKSGKLVYNNQGADELETNSELKLSKGSYVNNSAIVFLVSKSKNNLNASGIILSMNNFGTTLKNISFGTNSENLINQAGVIISEA